MRYMSKSFAVGLALLTGNLVLGFGEVRADPAQDQNAKRAEAERYIKSSEADWASSAVTNDASVLRRILADDYTGVSSSNRVVTKADRITQALAAKKPGEFLSNKLDHVDVHFFADNLAIAQGVESWQLRSGERGRYIWTDTWFARNGVWQIIASQDTRLSPAE